MRNKRHHDKKTVNGGGGASSSGGGAAAVASSSTSSTASSSKPAPRPGHHYHPVEGMQADRFTPRSFQVELLDYARRENTIVCLQTGSGKTFIAVMLVKEIMSSSTAVRKKLADGGKRAFFLVNTTPLVQQQAEAIRRHTDLEVGAYVGADGVDYWTRDRWYEEFEKHHVFVMTAQILLDVLHHHYFDLKDANLLIFDECHSVVKEHPMRSILKLYDEVPAADRPRVLGLTASLLNSKVKFDDLEAHIQDLEKSMRSCVRTASDHGQVEMYSTKPQEHLIECESLSTASLRLREDLDRVFGEAFGFIDIMVVELEEGETDPREGPKHELRKVQTILHELGPWPFYKMAIKAMNEANKNAECMPLQLNMYLLKWLETYLRQMCAMCENVFGEPNTFEDVLPYLSPKVCRVLECLREYAPASPSSSFHDSGCESSASNGGNNNNNKRTKESSNDNRHKHNRHQQRRNNAVESQQQLHQKKTVVLDVDDDDDDDEMEEEESEKEEAKAAEADSHAGGLCGIIFVERRIVAEGLNKCLNHLKQMDGSLDFIRPRHLVGHALRDKNKAYDENFEKEQKSVSKIQEEVLRRFRSNDVNLLVATDILKEGIHVPKCNVIVMFSLPMNFNTFIQSKGRARAPKSRYIMLCNESERTKFADALDEYKQIERVLRHYCHDRDAPEEEECDDHMADDILPPYIPAKWTQSVVPSSDADVDESGKSPSDATQPAVAVTSANTAATAAAAPSAQQPLSPRVTLTSAIPLVNRYCAKLPSDAFTHLTPKCETRMINAEGRTIRSRAAKMGEKVEEGILWVSSLRFPINSPIKDVIYGPPMRSKRLAQKAVALKACQTLHEGGELDDHLLPLGKDIRVEGLEDEDLTEEEREELAKAAAEEGAPRPGSTKRRQHYTKKISEMLSRGLPEPSRPCSLYVLSMQLTCPISEAQNTRGRRIYRPEDTSLDFGLLTCNQLPVVPGFPIYSRSGEVMVEAVLAPKEIEMKEEDAVMIINFHKFVFSSVLRLEKDPMQFDPKKAPSQYFVVPIQTKVHGVAGSPNFKIEAEIDWKFIEHVKKTVMELRQRRSDDRHLPGGCVDIKKYEDAVVMPWYRDMEQRHFFYVAELCNNLNPRSSFPSGEYETFYEYYYSKYGLEIKDKEQSLLDVDHTSLRLNLLTPRYMNHKGVMLPTSSAETKKAKRENLQQKQILVPELCDIHPFPAPLWRKAVCLPAILYRINALLKAEQLRQMIASKAGIGVVEINDAYPFPNMDFGWSKHNEEEASQRADALSNGSENQSAAAPAPSSGGGDGVDYDDEEDNDSDDDVDDREKAKRRLKRTTAKYQKTTGETVVSTRHLIHDPLAVIAERGVPDDYPEGGGSLGSHRDPYLDDDDDDSMDDGDDDDENQQYGDSIFNFGRNGFSHGSRSHGDGVSSDFIIGTWDPHEAASAPTWNPYDRLPASGLVGGDVGAEKPPEEALPHISFDVPPSDSASSTLKIDTWEDISRAVAGSGQAGQGWTDEGSIAITARGASKDKQNGMSNGTPMYDYSDDDMDSLLSDEDGLGLAEGDELMILDSGFGGFDLSFLNNMGGKSTGSNGKGAGKTSSNSNNSNTHPSKLNGTTGHVNSTSSHSSATKTKIKKTCDISTKSESSKSKSKPQQQQQSSMHGDTNLVGGMNGISASAAAVIPPPPPLPSSTEGALPRPPSPPPTVDQVPLSSIDAFDYFPPTEDSDDEDDDDDDDDVGAMSLDGFDEKRKRGRVKVVAKSEKIVELADDGDGGDANDDGPDYLGKGGETPGPVSPLNRKLDSISLSASPAREKAGGPASVILKKGDVDDEFMDTTTGSLGTDAVFSYQNGGVDLKTSPTNLVEEEQQQQQQRPSLPQYSSPQPSPQLPSPPQPSPPQPSPSVPRFSIDYQVPLGTHPGPSPCLILQALTMSNSNDGFNLERLEMIGDSFLKQAVTTFLFCTYPQMHEGRLSYFRSKQVSNYNLYKLGKRKGLAECMIATKFEPSENWLPPGFCISQDRAFPIAKWAAEMARKEKAEKADKAKPGGGEPSSPSEGGQSAAKKEKKIGGEEKKILKSSDEVGERANGGLRNAVGSGDSVSVVDDGVAASTATTTTTTSTTVEAADDELSSKERTKDCGPVGGNIDVDDVNEDGDDDKKGGNDKSAEGKKLEAKGEGSSGDKQKTSEKPKSMEGKQKSGEKPADAAAGKDKCPKTTTTTTTTVATRIDQSSLDLSKLHATLYKDTAIEHLPYILQIQHTLPDKSIADCVEALIGCYLTECGPRGALLLMAWLGLRVLPKASKPEKEEEEKEGAATETIDVDGGATVSVPSGLCDATTGPLCGEAQWAQLPQPASPLLDQPKAKEKLENLLTGFDQFEHKIGYQFRDRAYLLQAFTHASYHYNDITDCYQRLEFLGDAVLDYVITRHLFEDERKHSPGELTDLRSALVNNNIFAALAVRYDYHKYFKALSVGLFQVIEKYVALQDEQGDTIDIDQFANVDAGDDEEEETEETEVPKALGDVFESVAGAIFLDSGFSFDAVWRVYYRMMQPLLDRYSAKVPKSPVRELLEMEPETAKFEKPERTIDGRIRVSVNVIAKGKWRGVGRNYRIAKCACAKKALKALKGAAEGPGAPVGKIG